VRVSKRVLVCMGRGRGHVTCHVRSSCRARSGRGTDQQAPVFATGFTIDAAADETDGKLHVPVFDGFPKGRIGIPFAAARAGKAES
jgi:hypothetical protein